MVEHKIGLIREGDISTKKFRELAAELARLLTYEACADFELETVSIEGWAGPVAVDQIKGNRRQVLLRGVHAVGFESGLLLVSLPIIMAWTGVGWLEALIADIGLALAYVAYAFVFNLIYDRVFPIDEPPSTA